MGDTLRFIRRIVRRAVILAAPFVVPFFVFGILDAASGGASHEPNVWISWLEILLSLAIGCGLLFHAFRRRALGMLLIYVPLMLFGFFVEAVGIGGGV